MDPRHAATDSSRCGAYLRAAAALCGMALVLAAPAHADDGLDDARLGDELSGRLDPGDVDAYEFFAVEGTDLDVRLEGEGEGSGAWPSLAVMDPLGAQIGASDASPARVRLRTATSGNHLVEVRAGSFSGEYELEIDGALPASLGGEEPVSTEAGPAIVHLDVPRGSSVRVDVRRISGAAPRIIEIRDAAGRSLGFSIRRSRRSRQITHAVPVATPGGIDVHVAGRAGAAGTYRVLARPSLDDDDPRGEDEDDEEREPRRIVLQLRAGADPEEVAAALGYEIVFYEEGTLVLETPEDREGLEAEDARDAAALLADVLAAEADTRLQAPEGSQSNGLVLGSSLGRADFERQAALRRIRATAARRRATGRGVVVAVLDTGVDAAHPLLADVLLPGFDLVDRDADPAEERNELDDDGDGLIDEGWGHGTFVSGLVSAAAPDARIVPVRVLDSDARAPASVVAAGVYYAVSRDVDVINLSLGTRSRSETLRAAVAYAISRGVVVVAAAGNGGVTGAVDFPGAVRGTIAVTALDAAGRRPAFANAGGRTLLAAPGVDVIGPYPGGGYATGTGTSFAAALTSGGVATLLQVRPRLRPAQVERLLRRRARRFARRVPVRQRRLLGGGQLDLRRLAR